MNGKGSSPIQKALNSGRTVATKLDLAELDEAERQYTILKAATEKLKFEDNKEFLKIKGKTEKITERNFRPKSIEQFEHLNNVLQKHGNCDIVWKSFALLLECHNHLNKGKTGGNKEQPLRALPFPPKTVEQQNRSSSAHGGSPQGYTEGLERRKDLAKNEKQYFQLNSTHMPVTPQNVGRKNPRSSTHGGTPREYIDESEHGKGTEYRNDLGKYEERILQQNRELERSKAEAAKQSRIIAENEKMIQNLTTRFEQLKSDYDVVKNEKDDALKSFEQLKRDYDVVKNEKDHALKRLGEVAGAKINSGF